MPPIPRTTQTQLDFTVCGASVANKCSVHTCAATIGISHPDIVVETNTLSSVPPPDVTYTLSIPDSSINSGRLSALQLEAIIYACQVLLLSLLVSFLSQMSLVLRCVHTRREWSVVGCLSILSLLASFAREIHYTTDVNSRHGRGFCQAAPVSLQNVFLFL